MGLDLNGLNFLKYVNQDKPFGDVATLGRQKIHVRKKLLQHKFDYNINFGSYCEKLLIEKFGAKSVESFDLYENEQPTHIIDFGIDFH